MEEKGDFLKKKKKYDYIHYRLKETGNLVNNIIKRNNSFGILTPEISSKIQIINNSSSDTFNLDINKKKSIQFLSFRSATPVFRVPKKIHVSLYKITGEHVMNFKLDLEANQDYIIIITGAINNNDFPFTIKYIETSFENKSKKDFLFRFFNGLYNTDKNNKMSINIGKKETEKIEYGYFSKLYKFTKSEMDFFKIQYETEKFIHIPLFWFVHTFIYKSCFFFSSGYLFDTEKALIFSVFTDGTVILLPNIVNNQIEKVNSKENINQVFDLNSEKNIDEIEKKSFILCDFSNNNAEISNKKIKYELPGNNTNPNIISFLYRRYTNNITPSYCYHSYISNNEYIDNNLYFKINILEKKPADPIDNLYLIINKQKKSFDLIFGKQWLLNIDPIFSVKIYVSWNTKNIIKKVDLFLKENMIDSKLNIKEYATIFDNYPSFINENKKPGKQNIYERSGNTQNFFCQGNNVDISEDFYSVFSHYVNSEYPKCETFLKICYWDIYISVKTEDIDYIQTNKEMKLFNINVENDSIDFLIKSKKFYFVNQSNKKITENRKNAFVDLNISNNLYTKIPVTINFDQEENKYITSIEISKDHLLEDIKYKEDKYIQTYFNTYFNMIPNNEEILKIYGIDTRI